MGIQSHKKQNHQDHRSRHCHLFPALVSYFLKRILTFRVISWIPAGCVFYTLLEFWRSGVLPQVCRCRDVSAAWSRSLLVIHLFITQWVSLEVSWPVAGFLRSLQLLVQMNVCVLKLVRWSVVINRLVCVWTSCVCLVESQPQCVLRDLYFHIPKLCWIIWTNLD